jgi:hypothetical protein
MPMIKMLCAKVDWQPSMEFLMNEQIYLPLLATLGASLALIGFQAINNFEKAQKQKIYAINYMLDVAFRILSSTLIIKNHTIVPHIEATKRIIKGDSKLLEEMLLTDEFDILKANPMDFSHLPNEFKVLVGYDDIELVQMFDTFLYVTGIDENRLNLIEFVKSNLKSVNGFLSKEIKEREDILNTYWDILESLDHEQRRTLVFVREMLLPSLNHYIKGYRFLLFRTSTAKKKISNIISLIEQNIDSFSEDGYMEKVRHGGIQSAL